MTHTVRMVWEGQVAYSEGLDAQRGTAKVCAGSGIAGRVLDYHGRHRLSVQEPVLIRDLTRALIRS